MHPSVAGCKSCDIVAGRLVQPGGTIYADDCWHVDSVMRPIVWRGFLIIKSRRHVEHLADLTAAEAARLGIVIQATNQALMDVLHPGKIYNCSFGEGTRHVHFWVLPRPQDMSPGMHPVLFNLDIRVTLTRLLQTRRWLVPDNEVASIAQQVRERMKELTSG